MKQNSKPTRAQKEIIKKNGLNWKNWMILRGGEDKNSLTIIHKESGRRRVILK